MSAIASLTALPTLLPSGREQVVEAGVWREEEDAFGLVGLGVVDARGAAARRGARLLQLRAALREARFGEAQEDQAENRP
jgi:hypothetical protein